MTTTFQNEEMLAMVDYENGTVDRRIFADQDLYELELERIFAKAWNFMAHDSQIPNPGDFFMTRIGEDRVICVRDNDGNPQVLVNSCRHRGNAICRAEEGHSTSFMCTYHGWTYDLQGSLVGVPGFKEVYHEELDRENWGLLKAAQVDSYKGFIFANMDANAPGLNDYLGEVGRIGLDLIATQGDMVVLPGIQKYTIQCNWKLAADNVWDFYHPAISHASSTMSRWRPFPTIRPTNRFESPHVVVLGEYGHAISGPEVTEETRANQANNAIHPSWRDEPEAKAALGPVGDRVGNHPHIFPNCWLVPNGEQLCMRMPMGPTTTEIWWFTFIAANQEADRHAIQQHRAIHTFGPAGMLETDDGENWGESTRGMTGVISRQYPLHYAMNHRHDEVIEEEGSPAYIETHINEVAQLWLYKSWAEWMSADG